MCGRKGIKGKKGQDTHTHSICIPAFVPCPKVRQIALVALAVRWLLWLRQIASAHVTASQHILTYVETGVSGVTQSGFISLSSYTSIQEVV
jgi:hypothetical protein